ncbi:MAG: CoA transferase, partial [Sphingobium sp.]
MKQAIAFADRLCGEIARHGVTVNARSVLDRSDAMALGRPGFWSPNRSCRLIAASDGWIAVNLARTDDRDLVPALLERPIIGDPWRSIMHDARSLPTQTLLHRAMLLGLPAAAVGEADPRLPGPAMSTTGQRRAVPRVVDLSSLWAGPLCASILAQAGAHVVKVESLSRQDTTAISASALDARLNGAKRRLVLNFRDQAARAELRRLVMDADILVTSARARAFGALGLARDAVLAANPGLVWVAITGHGWTTDRVAFGDDAAVAGGLVRRTADGAPRFMGDALADPLTGLAAAAA